MSFQNPEVLEFYGQLPFNIYDASDELMFKIQNKMAVLGTIGAETPPSAVAGGLYYSGSDEWYFGYGTGPT